jgi:hypothetical protein
MHSIIPCGPYRLEESEGGARTATAAVATELGRQDAWMFDPQVEGAPIKYGPLPMDAESVRNREIKRMAAALGELCEDHDECLWAVSRVIDAWGCKAGR